MELKEIQELIRFVSKSGVSEVVLENKGFKLVIKTGKGTDQVATAPVPPVIIPTPAPVATLPASAPPPAPATPPPPPALAPQDEEATPSSSGKIVEIRSPMIGTFYRRPGPDKPPYVNVGDEVKQGQVICVIEAMKLFNEIEAEVSGKILKVLVDDASPVEYNQPLFLIETK